MNTIAIEQICLKIATKRKSKTKSETLWYLMCASTIDAESSCSGMDLGFKNRASHCVNIFPRGWLRLQSQMHLKIWGTINIFFRFVVRLHDELRTQLLWNGTVFLPRKPQCQHIPPVVGFVSHFKIMMHNQKYFSSFMRLNDGFRKHLLRNGSGL